MKIKIEIVTHEHETIDTQYISVESYNHAKEHHIGESILDEIVNRMLVDIKFKLLTQNKD